MKVAIITASTAVYKKGQKASITAEEGDVVKLYAVFVDDIAPVCSFSNATSKCVSVTVSSL